MLARPTGQRVIFVPVKRQHVPPQVSGQCQKQVAVVRRLPSAGVIRDLLFTGRGQHDFTDSSLYHDAQLPEPGSLTRFLCCFRCTE